jgi:hypothetical protein
VRSSQAPAWSTASCALSLGLPFQVDPKSPVGARLVAKSTQFFEIRDHTAGGVDLTPTESACLPKGKIRKRRYGSIHRTAGNVFEVLCSRVGIRPFLHILPGRHRHLEEQSLRHGFSPPLKKVELPIPI